MSTSAMHVAKTGLTAQQYKMQVIANNLANVNTTGFKRDRANFESLFYQIVKNAGSQTADNTALTLSTCCWHRCKGCEYPKIIYTRWFQSVLIIRLI